MSYIKAILTIGLSALFIHSSYAQTFNEIISYGLPVVVINTVNSEEPTAERIDPPAGAMGATITNATKVPGRIRIYHPENPEVPVYDSGEFKEGVSGMTMKIRGNTSALQAKKPYKIKLQKKADLLSRGEERYADKNWALIRHVGTPKFPCPIVFDLGNRVNELLEVSDWTPAAEYVNVIINDSYRGYYSLSETIERNQNCRLNVSKEQGFIFEIDAYWWNCDISIGGKIIDESGSRFTFKYPDEQDISDDRLKKFTQMVAALDQSIADGTYQQHIDVESFARWFLAHQILGTLDVLGSNIYLLKPDDSSKIQMGPLWDFDSILTTDSTFTALANSHYFKYLLKKSPNNAFGQTITDIWRSNRDYFFQEIMRYHDDLLHSDLATALDESINADFNKWHDRSDDIETTCKKNMAYFEKRFNDLDRLINTLDANYDEEEILYRKLFINGRIFITSKGKKYNLAGIEER